MEYYCSAVDRRGVGLVVIGVKLLPREIDVGREVFLGVGWFLIYSIV
jgi:hypothetical protein